MSCINLFHYGYCFNNRIIYIVMTKEQILQKLSLSKNIIDGISHNSNNKESCDAVSVLMEQVIQAISMSWFTSGTDLTGQTFGQLTVLGVHSKVKWENTSGYIYSWSCRCSCGKITYKNTHQLLHHKGLFPLMCRTCRMKIAKTTHGSCYTSLYVIWTRMKQSCYDPNYVNFKRYGGKGIIVCDEWVNDYSAFEEWAFTHGYREGLHIRRYNPNDNYTSQNCYFTSFNLITIDGESKTMLEWSKYYGVNYMTAVYRKNVGLPQELWFYKGKITSEVKSKYKK